MNDIWILPVMFFITLGLWRGYIGPIHSRLAWAGVFTLWVVFTVTVALILLVNEVAA